MGKIILSIVMVTYNHEKFIRQSLESVLAQKVNFAYEVILGEDCSTDNTRSIVKEFADRYPDIIKPIYHDKNVGALRNAYEFCYPRAKGEFIACLEGDDYWTVPDKLQKQVDLLKSNADLSFCFHSINAVNKEGEIIEKGNPANRIIFYKAIEIFHLKITTLSVVFRNCLNLSWQELVAMNVSDYILFALLSNCGGAADMGFVGGHYRRHDGGTYTGLIKIDRFKYSLSLLKHMKEIVVFSKEQKNEIDKEIIRRKKMYVKYLIQQRQFINVLIIALF